MIELKNNPRKSHCAKSFKKSYCGPIYEHVAEATWDTLVLMEIFNVTSSFQYLKIPTNYTE